MEAYKLMMSSLLKYQVNEGRRRQLIDYAPVARKAWLQLITYLEFWILIVG